MVNHRTAVSVLTVLLLGAAATVPADSAKDKKPAAALQLPISGAIAGGGTFAGTFSLSRFEVRGEQAWAVGFVRGSATTAAGVPLGTALFPAAFPVRVEGAGATASAAAASDVVAQATCQIVHIELGAQNINVLGVIVTTQPIVLDLSGDTAGPLGNLVCTLLDLVNNVVGLVDLLNQILGLLIGLLGAIIPG